MRLALAAGDGGIAALRESRTPALGYSLARDR